jgi:hypothetical protein
MSGLSVALDQHVDEVERRQSGVEAGYRHHRVVRNPRHGLPSRDELPYHAATTAEAYMSNYVQRRNVLPTPRDRHSAAADPAVCLIMLQALLAAAFHPRGGDPRPSAPGAPSPRRADPAPIRPEGSHVPLVQGVGGWGKPGVGARLAMGHTWSMPP